MAITLSDEARALFDGKNFATVATVNADGSPQTSVIWVKRDGDDVLFSTIRGRRKELNLARDPRVGIAVYDQDNPYRHVEIQGTATVSEQGGRALIEELAEKYTGTFPGEPAERVRVVVRITPERVSGS